MAIQISELKWYRAAVNNDGASNGGVMSANEIASNVAGNILPAATQAERTAGVTRYRKVFVKVANDDDLTLHNPRFYVENPTPADDRILIFAGTQTDVQDDLTGSERRYGAGTLDANVSAAATEIDVLMEDGGDDAIQDGDTIRISDMDDIDAGTGNEEYATVDGAPSKSGDVYTITLAAGLANAYTAGETRVAALMEASDIAASYSGFSVTTAGDGDYDDTAEPLVLDNLGTIEDSFTLTFTSATEFDVVGLASGALGSGTIAGGAAPTNDDFSAPYWTLASAGFSGTWASGDTIEFDTHPAAAAIWYEHIVPAGTESQTANLAWVVADGESA